MQIPFHRPYITDDEITAVNEAMRSGWLTMGEKTHEFERLFSQYTGMPFSVAVNSGTAALHLALCCIGLKPGDEVIIPSLTFVATAEVIRYFNASPVLADISRETHCIIPDSIAKHITPKTRAILPVHFAGQPADMDEILSLAENKGLRVIEDAAHALPASYKGKMIGALGDITCFSFYATKTLTTGEGGMAVTASADWEDLMKQLRLHGISRDAWNRYAASGSWQYDVVHAGYKYNMTDISAAMGIEQLKKVDLMLDMRRSIAQQYTTAFSQSDGLIPYTVKEDRESSWHLYPLKLNPDALSINRDRFIEELKKAGITTSVHFIPLYRFTYYKGNPAEYPEAEWVFERSLSLPIYPGMSDEEVEYVIEKVVGVAHKFRR